MDENKIHIQVDIDVNRVSNLIETALNHIGYWCEVVGEELPTENFIDMVIGNGKLELNHLDPDNGELIELVVWNRETVEKGLKLMAEKHPYQFAQFMSNQGDMVTGDVFAQLCLLGDVLYG
jgi:hypothetical protein